ncbi:MAG TPA: hypothetical protein VN894_19820 [Polyangiaceae bacterium]|nr:hypothetical protein [Polyangiaceae bacterium]
MPIESTHKRRHGIASAANWGVLDANSVDSVTRVERELSELILVEECPDVVALARLVPSDGCEVEQAMLGPAREQAEARVADAVGDGRVVEDRRGLGVAP